MKKMKWARLGKKKEEEADVWHEDFEKNNQSFIRSFLSFVIGFE